MNTSFVNILKRIGNLLLKGFKWVFSNAKNFVIILLAVLCLVMTCEFYSTKKDLEKTKIEFIASNDTITSYRNKVGELYAAKETYITDIKELKKVNEDLYKEYKNLKEHPIVIEKIQTVVKIDSIYIKDTVTLDSLKQVYTANFNYSDKHCSIAGATSFDLMHNNANTSIYNIELPATFTTDIIEKDNKLYFLSKCDNPYVEINNIEGAIVSPEQSKLLKKKYNRPWGVMIGVGPSVTVVDNTVKIYPALQVTVGYKFISF